MKPKISEGEFPFVERFFKEFKKNTHNRPLFVFVGYANVVQDENGKEGLDVGSTFYAVVGTGNSSINQILASELNKVYGNFFFREMTKFVDEEES